MTVGVENNYAIILLSPKLTVDYNSSMDFSGYPPLLPIQLTPYAGLHIAKIGGKTHSYKYLRQRIKWDRRGFTAYHH